MNLFSLLKNFFKNLLSWWRSLCRAVLKTGNFGGSKKKKTEPGALPLPPGKDKNGGKYLSKQDQIHPCSSYNNLKLRFRDIGRENGIMEILGRDFLTAMPKGAYHSRLGQIAYLFRRMHEDLISEEISQLLGEASAHEYTYPDEWDEWDRANLREMERLYRGFCHLDPDLMERRARLSYEGRHRHVQVLKDNDWESAKQFLQEQIDLNRSIAEARGKATGETSAYQSLLSEYMPDINVADVEKWFSEYSRELDNFLPRILEKQDSGPEPIPLGNHYSPKGQMVLNRSLLNLLGFDFDRGGLYETGHNPVEGGTPDDTRLVIKIVDPTDFLGSMKSALHEGGHGLYIQGLPRKEWRYQPVAMDLGAAVHESQAMITDMIIGRMREFFEFLSPRTEGLFHSMGDPALTPENLYALRTRVTPAVDRRHADEVTYFKHIKMRFDLERDLIDGKLEVKDLPEAWTETAHKQIGIRPNSYSEGCLQDVHWFVGKFGYFPSYALGQMMAAQQYDAMKKDLGNIQDLVRRGCFTPITNWLHEKIHSKGRLMLWDDLMEQSTGRKLEPSYLASHLKEKYLGQ
jgi:carboxypeptidase Taq